MQIERFSFTPNAGAQDAFVRSSWRYPAFIGGLFSGKTWAGSAKLVILHAWYAGTDSLAVAPTYPNLRQIAIPALIERLNEAGVAHEVRLSTMEILTPKLDSKILLHSGLNAERITGFTVGRTWIDEPARIPDFQEPHRNVWINCIGRTRSPDVPAEAAQVFVTGTHEGKGTWLYQDWEEKPKPHHAMFRGATTENPIASDYARVLQQEYGPDLAEQYVQGLAIETSVSAIPYDTIVELVDPRCRRAAHWEMLARSSVPLYVGMDIGRRKSLTVFWVLSAHEENLITEAVIEMRDATFGDQQAMIDRLCRLPGMSRIAIDATYNPQTAEDAEANHGTLVDPVIFTTASKLELCQSLIKAAQTGWVRIPEGQDIVMDWYSVKRVVNALGKVSYDAPMTADGHSDRFFSAALAVRAARQGVSREMEYIGGPPLRSAGMRGL